MGERERERERELGSPSSPPSLSLSPFFPFSSREREIGGRFQTLIVEGSLLLLLLLLFHFSRTTTCCSLSRRSDFLFLLIQLSFTLLAPVLLHREWGGLSKKNCGKVRLRKGGKSKS
jgi:hypothetical protein